MAVTDLTGTKWILNDTITIPIVAFTFDFTDLSGQTFNGMSPTTTVLYYGYINDSGSQDGLMAYSNPKWLKTDYQTITITGGTDATNTTLISWLESNATQIPIVSFKHLYRNTTLIGTGTYKFRPYTVIQPQLSIPANISADGTTVSWDEVENATSYEVFADGTSIGEVENQTVGYNLSIARGSKTGYSENLYGWINIQTGELGEKLNNGNYENVYKVICYSGGGGPIQILSYTGQITINGSAVQLNYDYYGNITIELSSDATFTYVAAD